jgi:hypothetical protein
MRWCRVPHQRSRRLLVIGRFSYVAPSLSPGTLREEKDDFRVRGTRGRRQSHNLSPGPGCMLFELITPFGEAMARYLGQLYNTEMLELILKHVKKSLCESRGHSAFM